MKNLIIYSFLIVFFFNCSSKVYTYKNAYTFEYDISRAIYKKKSGTFKCPDLGVECNIKRGEYDGVFKIIYSKDTIYYSNFNKGIPYGRYKCDLRGVQSIYYRFFINPKFSFVKRKPNIIEGYGFYNNKGQKEGEWYQNSYRCSSRGSYIKGLKDGLWENHCFSCFGNISYKKELFLNGKSIKVLDSL